MPGYEVETHTHHIGGLDYKVRGLADRMQHHDPHGRAETAGVPPSSWSHFGVLWPAGLALAQAMSVLPVAGLRILEMGCGLGLASLVLKRRGADITASDHHPLAEQFLRQNESLNRIAPISFHCAPWRTEHAALGRFDLLIGADLLYERGQGPALGAFVGRHSRPAARVVLADAGRGYSAPFTEVLRRLGFAPRELRVWSGGLWPPGRGGKILTFGRPGEGGAINEG
jgi:predicted nicotinamide N-methyase